MPARIWRTGRKSAKPHRAGRPRQSKGRVRSRADRPRECGGSTRSDQTTCEIYHRASLVPATQGWYNAAMKLSCLALVAFCVLCLTARPARADVTLFLGSATAAGTHGPVKGFAAGVSLLIVGFEFEYANRTEDTTLI